MPISDQELHELADVYHRTTAGLWSVNAIDETKIQSIDAQRITDVAHIKRLVDADFIAAAHRAVPLMIAEIRQLRAERERSLWQRFLTLLKGG